MRILLVPMAAMAETGGPAARTRQLAAGFMRAGFEVGVCAARDVNYRQIEGTREFPLAVPMPMGLPAPIARRTFPVARKLGITARKEVHSFDEVLRFTGNLSYDYLKRSVEEVRSAIKQFAPDYVYSEFNISAIIAARAEGVRVACSVSRPTQSGFACAPQLARGVNRLLDELGLTKVNSALQLFEQADVRICPSIPELEPMGDDVVYCGTLKAAAADAGAAAPAGADAARNNIVVYMGNGTVSASGMLDVVRGAFGDSGREVYVASSYLDEADYGNVHVASRWDFGELLPGACLFINHGGQNSIVDGLLNGVPQMVVPGKVFERKYNAESIASAGAGAVLDHNDFKAENVRALAGRLMDDEAMRQAAADLGNKLRAAGGVETIVRALVN